MIDLKAEDIQVGKVYIPKKRRYALAFEDRLVVWINKDRTMIQYDSDTIRNGRHYPIISMERFLKWAKGESK